VPPLLEHTGGVGVDHIVDVAGPQSLVNSLRALRLGGQINVVGYLGGMAGDIDRLMLLERQATLRGLQIGPRVLRRHDRAMALHRTRPAIDRVLPWTDVSGALVRLRSGEHFGKIVLRLG
jgi:NADPH:quinone reductase-like Zn-dependent oxidoreductase